MTRPLPMRTLVAIALPARLIHELLHALTALPWAERVQIEMRPDGDARARIAWRANPPPRAVVVLSALAPLLAGVLAAVVAVAMVVVGDLSTPSTPTELSLAAIAGAYVAMIANVQKEDVNAAFGPREGGAGDGDD